jgi:hypothetical protein
MYQIADGVKIDQKAKNGKDYFRDDEKRFDRHPLITVIFGNSPLFSTDLPLFSLTKSKLKPL